MAAATLTFEALKLPLGIVYEGSAVEAEGRMSPSPTHTRRGWALLGAAALGCLAAAVLLAAGGGVGRSGVVLIGDASRGAKGGPMDQMKVKGGKFVGAPINIQPTGYIISEGRSVHGAFPQTAGLGRSGSAIGAGIKRNPGVAALPLSQKTPGTWPGQASCREGAACQSLVPPGNSTVSQPAGRLWAPAPVSSHNAARAGIIDIAAPLDSATGAAVPAIVIPNWLPPAGSPQQGASLGPVPMSPGQAQPSYLPAEMSAPASAQKLSEATVEPSTINHKS